MSEEYPEGLFKKIQINLELDEFLGGYLVSCPQWKFETYSKNPDELAKKLIKEIINHNNQEVLKECDK